MRTIGLAVLVGFALLLCGCGGGAAEHQGARSLAADLGCPHAKISHHAQGAEPPRGDRADCHGVTVVTFSSNDARDSYVSAVEKINSTFGQSISTVKGDGWAAMGSKRAIEAAKSKLGD